MFESSVNFCYICEHSAHDYLLSEPAKQASLNNHVKISGAADIDIYTYLRLCLENLSFYAILFITQPGTDCYTAYYKILLVPAVLRVFPAR